MHIDQSHDLIEIVCVPFEKIKYEISLATDLE